MPRVRRRNERLAGTAREEQDRRVREREPSHPRPNPRAASAPLEPGLVAEPAGPVGPPQALVRAQPDGRGLQLRRGVQDPRRRGAEAGRLRRDDDVAGLVAGRLRPLRPAVHPDVVARRGHVPHRRRPGRRWRGRAALRPAQQLARQRQPRQGAPVALAGQAEVRAEDLLGRPDHLRRELRVRVDGVQDVRLRASGERTSGSPRRSSGDPRTRGSATSATAATGSSPVRSAPCRWA